MLLNKIKNLADKNHPTVIGLRRHLHQHPELSFQTPRTFFSRKRNWKIRFRKTKIMGHSQQKRNGWSWRSRHFKRKKEKQ